MAIEFNIQTGGLGRRVPGNDFISGILFPIPNATLPSGFTSTARSRSFGSLAEAEAAGIVANTTDNIGVAHYHISEFFRIYAEKTRRTPELWVSFFDSNTAYDGTQLTALQTAADGVIKQFAVYSDIVFAASIVANTRTVLSQFEVSKRPAIAILAANFFAISDINTVVSVRALNAQGVGVDLGESTTGRALVLRTALSKSIGSIGVILGSIAVAAVHENIGWVEKFDISDADEHQEPGFANGQLVKDVALSITQGVATKGYIFATKIQDAIGAFFHDFPLAVPIVNDLSYGNETRTIYKALRGINIALTPRINAPLYVDSRTGFLSEEQIFEIESLVLTPLQQMATDLELSVDQQTQRLSDNTVVIPPNQNILQGAPLNITVRMVPVGTQRETIINIGFVPNIA